MYRSFNMSMHIEFKTLTIIFDWTTIISRKVGRRAHSGGGCHCDGKTITDNNNTFLLTWSCSYLWHTRGGIFLIDLCVNPFTLPYPATKVMMFPVKSASTSTRP